MFVHLSPVTNLSWHIPSAQTSERNHAMRTAMLATCEAQLETLQQELRDKDATSHEAIERVTSLQASLAAAEARLAERVKEATAGPLFAVDLLVMLICECQRP
jgi:hypothetical protein